MSIAEFPNNSGRARAAEFERTPPQDVIAEQSVLGGMLLSKDAISDVVEILRAPIFSLYPDIFRTPSSVILRYLLSISPTTHFRAAVAFFGSVMTGLNK